MDDLKKIVQSLLSNVSEEEWYEFKENWYDTVGIGEYISSLSNAAAMCGKECAYLIWGINNDTHEVLGTTFILLNDFTCRETRLHNADRFHRMITSGGIQRYAV